MRTATALRALAATTLAIALGGAGATAAPATPAPAAPAPDVDAARAAAGTTVDVPAADLPAICRQQKNIVCIDKATRTLSYLENGQEWLSAEVRFGRVGYETPKGTWRVDTKAPDQWWSYPYRVFMPWGMKFDSKQGLYIHYSSGFALNPQTYIGSHGCVQLGDWETARKLYERVPVNTMVHIY
ncbi:MAG: L,D-transpeptidase [Austwickia sp.]|jgi:lipoprotein-anchoring transpeptidase ErfK/SrfK|nr:MAG: L,D-transpeptidase [Austwickia sp.]